MSRNQLKFVSKAFCFVWIAAFIQGKSTMASSPGRVRETQNEVPTGNTRRCRINAIRYSEQAYVVAVQRTKTKK